jgi:hypothetical protein
MKKGRTGNFWDYYAVAVVRVRHRHTESTEISGRTIRQRTWVAVGVTLAPDTFTLQTSTESGRGK